MSATRDGCGTCARIATRDDGTAPLWDNILRTPGWDVVHCYDTSLLGWLVLVPRRHIEAVDQLSDAEALELGGLLRATSAFLRAETGCVKTYVMQFAEDPEHPHVHFHVVPRLAGFQPEEIGANVFKHLGVDDDTRVTEADMNGLAARMRRYPKR